MSLEARTEIADAVSTVDGVTCAPYSNQATTAGSAYVRRGASTFDGFGVVVTWEVFVMLPTNLKTAEEELDRLVPAVRAALDRILIVSALEPVTVQFDQTSKPALMVRGTREEDQ